MLVSAPTATLFIRLPVWAAAFSVFVSAPHCMSAPPVASASPLARERAAGEVPCILFRHDGPAPIQHDSIARVWAGRLSLAAAMPNAHQPVVVVCLSHVISSSVVTSVAELVKRQRARAVSFAPLSAGLAVRETDAIDKEAWHSLTAVGTLTEISVRGLVGEGEYSGARGFLRAVGPSSRLVGIDLAESNVSDEDVRGNLPDTIEWLDLSGTRIRSLKCIAPLKNLRSLSLRRLRLESDDLRRIAEFPRLQHLCLAECTFPPSSLECICQSRTLRRLDISNCELEGAFIDRLGSMEQLQELHVGSFLGHRISALDLRPLNALAGLRHLEVHNVAFGGGQGLDLRKFHELVHVSLDHCSGLGASEVEAVRDAAKLAYLRLSGSSVPDEMWEAVGSLRQLVSLRVDETGVSSIAAERMLMHLADGGRSMLEVLDLSGCDIGDEVAVYVSRLPRVRCIYVSGTRISDVFIREVVASQRELEQLDCSRSRVSDVGVSELRKCRRLWLLGCADCNGISNASVGDLEKIEGLSHLYVGPRGIPGVAFGSLVRESSRRGIWID